MKLIQTTGNLIAKVLLVGTLLAGASLPTAAFAAQSDNDCNGNSVIPGGVSSLSDLKQKFQTNPCGNTKALYQRYGITSVSDFNGMVTGHVDTANNVYKDTGVYTNGGTTILVGKDAMSVGRQNISNQFGSSVAIMNGQFYKRSVQVAMGSKNGTLDTLVKLDTNGKFLFGIIMNCGNPVSATPVIQKPQPKPTTTKTTTNITINNTTNTTNNNQTTQVAAQQPTKLVDTGAGDAIGIFVAVSLLGALAHRLFLARRLQG